MFVNSDFSDLLRLFNANQVKYLVVGGYALIVGGTLPASHFGDAVKTEDHGSGRADSGTGIVGGVVPSPPNPLSHTAAWERGRESAHRPAMLRCGRGGADQCIGPPRCDVGEGA
jgi:hypothetical protein